MRLRRINKVLILLTITFLFIGKSNFMKDKLDVPISSIRLKIITKGMEFQKDNNITYYYDNKVKMDFDYISYLKTYISQGDVEASKYFGSTSKYPLNIVTINTSKAFENIFRVNPEESLSLFDGGAIYINYEKLAPYVFVHEYTHYKMSAFCEDKKINFYSIPQWFKEGVSEYVCSTFYLNKYKNPSLKKIQDFRKLDNNKEIKDSIHNGYDVYMQSYLAVKKIIQLKGQNSIKSILINSETMGFYNAIEKELNMSIDDFQALLSTSSGQ